MARKSRELSLHNSLRNVYAVVALHGIAVHYPGTGVKAASYIAVGDESDRNKASPSSIAEHGDFDGMELVDTSSAIPGSLLGVAPIAAALVPADLCRIRVARVGYSEAQPA